MKKILILILFINIILSVYAQNSPKIKFEETSINIGSVKQEVGTVTNVFKFKNTGSDTLKIIMVQPSCGCTSVKYTNDPVLPGNEGTIETIYDAAKNHGEFKKSIIVYTNDRSNPHILLYLLGHIIPKEKTIVERKYKQGYGNLRMVNNHFMIEKININDKKTQKLCIYNAWGKTMKLEFKNIPVWVTIKPCKLKLKAQKEAEIEIIYDANKRNKIGEDFCRISIMTDDTLMQEKVIYITANVIENKVETPPEICFKTTEYNFAEAKEGDKIPIEFEFENKGQSDLIIKEILSSDESLTTSVEKKTIKAGEKGSIKAIFNTNKKIGAQKIEVTIVNNDPKKPKITLTIKGKVRKAS